MFVVVRKILDYLKRHGSFNNLVDALWILVVLSSPTRKVVVEVCDVVNIPVGEVRDL